MVIIIFYFTIISPVFVSKPYIDKMELLYLGDSTDVQIGHVAWLINELGFYKLHNAPLSDVKPKILLVLPDINQTFAITIQSGVPIKAVNTENPDLTITSDSMTFGEMYEAADIPIKINEFYTNGKVSLEVNKDEATLALMGYKEIYDTLKL